MTAALHVPGRAREHLGAVVLLCVASVALHGEAVFTNRVFFRRDVLVYWYPLVETFVRVVAQGSWPLWDPFEGFGIPMLADPGSQVLYPTTWLNLLLLPHTVYKLLVLGHSAFTGVGLYLLARRFSLGTTGAVAAGLGWMLSGPFVSLAGLYHHYCGAAWIPWVMLAFERALTRPTARFVLVLSAVAALQVFAGSGDMVVMSGLAVAGRAGLFLRENRGPETLGVRGASRRVVLLAVGALAATVALSAGQLWPTLAHLRSTHRVALQPADNLFWSLHPGALVDSVVPRLVGERPYQTWMYEGREPFLESIYFGAAFFLPVVLGLFCGGRRARFLAVMCAVMMLLAMGRYTPLLPALAHVPPFSLFRYPVKYLVPAALTYSLLAGTGIDAIARASFHVAAGRKALITGALAVFLGLLALAWLWWWPSSFVQLTASVPGSHPDHHPSALSRMGQAVSAVVSATVLIALRMEYGRFAARWAWGLVVLGALDLGLAAHPLNPLAPAELSAHGPPLLARLEHREGHRLLSPTPSFAWLNAQLARGPAGWTPEASFALGLQEMIYAPSGARWGVHGSFDADFTGLADQALPAASLLVRRLSTTEAAVRLLRLGNVGHVIEIEQGPFSMLPEVARADSVFATPLRLLKVPRALDRAYVVGRARQVDDLWQAFHAITDPSFVPEQEVVLSLGSLPSTDGSKGRASVRLWRADRAVIETESTGPGFLVLVQTYDPGWRASISGEAVPVQRANALFQAVPIPAGRSLVELVYRPPAALWGLTLSALAWTATLMVLSWPQVSLLTRRLRR